MIPYVTAPPFFIGDVAVQPFALLVSAGILVAHFLLLARASRAGLIRGWAAEMSLAMVICGFAGAVLFKLLYRPELIATVGWTGALRNFPGISSFGGLFGALAGGWSYLLARRVSGADRLRYFDAVGFSFPFGFSFGRLGCTLAHDHPGLRSDSGWLTVAFPDGARYDLGLLELLSLIVTGAMFVWLDRQPRPPGFFAATMLLLYGPFRVALDRLHVDPPRYAGLSVDMWAGGAITLAGLFLWQRSRTARRL
jgi:phosphatidylglycerol---prolipoprotein diacylglyceryl transferase